MTKKENFRTESDLLGQREVTEEAYYGVQTMRAMENFRISGNLLNDYANFIRGMAITKKAAAIAKKEESKAVKKAVENLKKAVEDAE